MEDFVGLITQGGIIGVIGVWLYFERLRAERLEAERSQLIERMLKAMNDNNVGLKEIKDGQEETNKLASGMRELMIRGRRE